MCRWVFYHGHFLSVDALLVTPQNSLIYQAGPGAYTPGAERSPLFDPGKKSREKKKTSP